MSGLDASWTHQKAFSTQHTPFKQIQSLVRLAVLKCQNSTTDTCMAEFSSRTTCRTRAASYALEDIRIFSDNFTEFVLVQNVQVDSRTFIYGKPEIHYFFLILFFFFAWRDLMYSSISIAALLASLNVSGSVLGPVQVPAKKSPARLLCCNEYMLSFVAKY